MTMSLKVRTLSANTDCKLHHDGNATTGRNSFEMPLFSLKLIPEYCMLVVNSANLMKLHAC